jgi:inorganic pyrophosphatase
MTGPGSKCAGFDPIWNSLNDLSDMNPHLLKEIEHFFQVYKDLENKTVDVRMGKC